MPSPREFHLARPVPPHPARAAAICSAFLVIGVGVAIWASLDTSGPMSLLPVQRVMAYVVAALLITISIAAPVASWRQRRRPAEGAPALVLDDQGFTTWGDLRVRWDDVTSWEVFHHDEVYDDDVPEDHPDYIGPSRVDELLILVHVEHPEAMLRRLAPEVRSEYENDTFGQGKRFGTPIRVGADDLDAPSDEVVAEFERYSGMSPHTR
ncbi:hypothetical protein [Promicromonospora sp. NPDC019610]|uniref:hypothetical protein n=1 Tax=Promicromonospora sp. NPDC019610 TaxID=3364405 RepID=UPI0037992A43